MKYQIYICPACKRTKPNNEKAAPLCQPCGRRMKLVDAKAVNKAERETA